MPSFIWRYLISTGDVGLEKTLVDIFSVARAAWQRDMSICLMGSLVVRLVQQIGRSGHGENVMKSCVGVCGLWKCRYLPWHDVTKDGLSRVRTWLVKVSDKSELSTQLLCWWLVVVGRVTMMENTKSYYGLVPVCHLAIFGHQQLSSHHSHQLSLADSPSHSGDMRRVRSIVYRYCVDT